MSSAGSDEVTRWRLIDALEQTPPGALVLLVAAAGYGKSTLLRQWARQAPSATAVAAARPEDDAASLLATVADELVRSVPDATRLQALAARAEADWACDLLPALLELAARHPFALAIDDTHVLSSPSSREALAELARAWPAPSVLVLSGRERPPVPLVRSAPDAPMISLSERDLDFDDAEVDALLALEEQPIARSELLELTGGWPAGVRLGALVRGSDLGGTQMTVERYLTSHVLSAFSPDELDFLGYLAALAPAPARTIDLVLRRNDTLDVLRLLELRGLPMVEVPTDPATPIVVHALLAQVLQARLERHQPGALDRLVSHAVEVAQRAGELEFGFALLDQHGRRDELRSYVYVHTFTLVSQGRTRQLRGWLERFPIDELEHDPHLVFAHANVQRPRDEFHVRTLFVPHSTDATTVLPDGITPALAVPRMLTAFGLQPADPDDRALLGGWRQTSGMTRAWDLYADDRLEEAEAVLRSLRDSAHKYPLTDAVGLAKLAILALETGRPEEAAVHAAEAARIMSAARMEETALGFIVDTVAIKLARRAGDLPAADDLATAARRKIAKVGDGTMLEQATTFLEIAGLYLDLDEDALRARPLLDEAAGILGRWPATTRLDRQLVRLVQLADQLDATHSTAQRTELITTAELRVLRYLPSHLTLARIADELYVSHSTVKTQCQSIYRKLHVGTRADAVTAATQLGLLA